MYLQKPKFKFCLFLVDNEKKKINQTICHAESYEIQQDGSIIFYQIAVKNEKNIKVPVLAYPKGKWEACILVDDNNEYPVFNNSNNVSHANSNANNTSTATNSKSLLQQSDSSSTATQKYKTDITTKSLATNGFDDLDNFDKFENSPTADNGFSHSGNPQVQMNSGTSQSINPQEFKKLKSEWLDKLIIDFVKKQDFHMIEFMKSISHDPQLTTFKPSENDITWAAANLIQNRLVLSRKFSEPGIQKQFDFILGGIMKRLWDGQMAPILTTLQEKEETKYANAIDLAVWMSKNNY